VNRVPIVIEPEAKSDNGPKFRDNAPNQG
jgi:hypothetical protein